VAVFLLTCHRGVGARGWRIWVGVKASLGLYRKQVDVEAEFVPAVLECANCSLHETVGCALSETIVQCLDCLCCPGSPVVCKWRKRHAGKSRWFGPLDWPCVHVHAGSNDAAFR